MGFQDSFWDKCTPCKKINLRLSLEPVDLESQKIVWICMSPMYITSKNFQVDSPMLTVYFTQKTEFSNFSQPYSIQNKIESDG